MKTFVTIGLSTVMLITSSISTIAAIPTASGQAHQATGDTRTFQQNQTAFLRHFLRQETARDVPVDQVIDWFESGMNTSVGQDAAWRPFRPIPGATSSGVTKIYQ